MMPALSWLFRRRRQSVPALAGDCVAAGLELRHISVEIARDITGGSLRTAPPGALLYLIDLSLRLERLADRVDPARAPVIPVIRHGPRPRALPFPETGVM